MASNDPGIAELDDPVSIEVRDALSRVCVFEDALKMYFECSKKVIPEMLAIGNYTSLEISRVLVFIINEPRSTYLSYSDLRKAYHSMFASALVVAGPDVRDMNLQPSKAEQSAVEKAFLAVIALIRRQEEYREGGSEPTSDFALELENGIVDLYFSVKRTVKREPIYPVFGMDIIEYVINDRSQNPAFDRSFIALAYFIGVIAADEMELPDIRTRAAQVDMPPIMNLYTYMGYRYNIISKEDYKPFQRFTSPFGRKIGKAAIFLAHALRPKITENLIGVMIYFKINSKTCNSLYYITRFVRDSIKAYPSSSYRYMVLLCLISEITLALYHDKEKKDPFDDYLDEACIYYNESGMDEYETRFRSYDGFQDLKNCVKHLYKAWKTWKTVSPGAIDVVSRSRTTRDLMARYDDRLGGKSFELVSSRTSKGDKDLEKDSLKRLLLDDQGILNPEYQGVSDYLDLRSKSPLPKADQESANVKGKSNLEGQKGESSTNERKGSGDIEGESNPEGQMYPSPTKRRRGPANVGGKSKPKGLMYPSPTKRRKGPANVEGQSNPKGQKQPSPAKRRKGPADVEGKYLLPGRVYPSPNPFPKPSKIFQRSKTGVVDASWNYIPESQVPELLEMIKQMDVTSRMLPGSMLGVTDVSVNNAPQSQTSGGQGLAVVHDNFPMVPTGQKQEPSTQSPLHPSGGEKSSPGKSSPGKSSPGKAGKSSPGKAGKSSPGVQPKSADDERGSNTETPEDVPPREGASPPRPKRKKSE